MTTATLKVGGMSCGHCAMTVTRALQSVPGVRDARVELQQGRAVVEYDEARADMGALVGAVEEEGYTAESAA